MPIQIAGRLILKFIAVLFYLPATTMVMARLSVLLTPQVFLENTVMYPLVLPKSTEIFVVPCP